MKATIDNRTLLLIIPALLAVAWGAAGATTQETLGPDAAKVQIVLSSGIEDKKPILRADVSMDGKPLKDVKVQFAVKRTFGELVLGNDQTLDDGSAAVAFPDDLPGGPGGELGIVARVVEPERYKGAAGQATLTGGLAVTPVDQPAFPRALWAPHAPLPLVFTIVILLAGVWSAYVFCVIQIIRIRKGDRK